MRLAKGVLAGAVAGVAASAAMTLFDKAWQQRWPEPSYEDDITLRFGGSKAGALAVHLLFGTALGAAYGAAVECWPKAAKAAGVPFFVSEAVLGNEVIGPRLGWFRPASKYPASKHLNSVTTHIVYGVVAELVRREVRDRL